MPGSYLFFANYSSIQWFLVGIAVVYLAETIILALGSLPEKIKFLAGQTSFIGSFIK